MNSSIGIFFTAVFITIAPGLALAEVDADQKKVVGIDLHARYPGDASLRGGNARRSGTERGAYIEKCRWFFNPSVSKGFGLSQTCFRYTLKNTR